MTGKLQRYNWDTLRYDGYRPPANGRTVWIQFKPAGGAWVDYKKVTIGAGGVTNGAVVAHGDGHWRYRYPGNVPSASSYSKADFIDVR
jgi:hypothetical protein